MLSTQPTYEPFVLGLGSTQSSEQKDCPKQIPSFNTKQSRSDSSSSTCKMTIGLKGSPQKTGSEEKTIEYEAEKDHYSEQKGGQTQCVKEDKETTEKDEKEYSKSYVEVLECQLKKYQEIPWISEIRKKRETEDLALLLGKMYEEYCNVVNENLLLEMKINELQEQLNSIKTVHQLVNRFNSIQKKRTNDFVSVIKNRINLEHPLQQTSPTSLHDDTK
ncbi:hypothetical protein EIN_043920 [Entamoeba invadens IP1]|uniref:Uncharacterized protein n=1 Tax=Entamoeba invadens IP1 TaxID=370355 RepID=A0A0A1TZ71_ENTIV|nr:hypothetical protein EIN_043920 [Entamoeba invadens IP1]ELP86844.1 hypothetical protein EIN_043920 [Entamoeba invadens IP1]|eukprot:XP_004253615.1 hypothetical protein EIN_043920 [Entamoeba invadens IP1]